MAKCKLSLVALALLTVSGLQAQTTSPATESRVNDILSKLTLEEKIDYIGGYNDFYIRAIPRLGVPELKMTDGPVGVRNYGPSTTLAGGVSLAATWDPELVERAGKVLGEDARSRGVHFLLGPAVNIYRAPMAARSFEYFGEDPFLTSQTAVAYIKGVQTQHVCATIKHYIGNNQEYDRHNIDSLIDERTMREIYLPSFEAAVKQANVCAIMDSYNLTNGEHMSQNGYLNNDVAKKEWGFDGIIMSDWDSTYDGVAAVNGGLDLEMPSGKSMNRQSLLPAVKAGKVSEATIDEHVRRILRKAVEFGWLQGEQTDFSISRYNLEGRQVALEAARASMVLLKNSNSMLPLNRSQTKVLAVIGPDAYPGEPVGGGSAQVKPFHTVSAVEGLAHYLHSSGNILYSAGIPTLSEIADATTFSTDSSSGKPGLKREAFKSEDLSGSASEGYVDEHINFGGDGGPRLSQPAGSFRWTGSYSATKAGIYKLFVQGPAENCGYRVWIDDQPVIDSWSRAQALANYAALNLTAGAHRIRFEFHRGYESDLRLGIFNSAEIVSEEAKKMAAIADSVVLAVGFDPASEGEGADRSFQLPPGQEELIQAMAAVNRRVAVVITSGGGIDMSLWAHQVPAILQSWYSGQEGGTALAQILFGEVNPSGKLPVSFERRFEDNAAFGNYYPNAGDKRVKYNEGVFIGYRHYDKSQTKPLFPFGHGLSYTTFQYSGLNVSPQSGTSDTPITVTFSVKNTGSRPGAEVAQLYVGVGHSRVPRPVKELKGFSKVNLQPGESKTVSLTLDKRSFAYYSVESKQWKVDPGEFGILIGSSSEKIELKGSFRLAN